MRRRFRQVDVFTIVPFKGNPVAVVLDGDGLDTEQMQAIAHWTNLSETTFACTPTHPEADYRLRIFCPANEMRFAGHPTIGSAYALLSSGFVAKQPGALVQECGVGLVHLKTGADGIGIALPPARFNAVGADVRTAVEAALGASLLDAPVTVDLGVAWLTGQVSSGEYLRSLQPDMLRVAAAARLAGVNGINIFGMDGETVEVRSFAPHEGTPEDPVCGSGNGAVAYYLRERGGPRNYAARQGRCVGRDGHIVIACDAEDMIWLSGHAVTCIEGSIVT